MHPSLMALVSFLQVLCVLPQCVDVVEGVLGADLVGFHTYNYLHPGLQKKFMCRQKEL